MRALQPVIFYKQIIFRDLSSQLTSSNNSLSYSNNSHSVKHQLPFNFYSPSSSSSPKPPRSDTLIKADHKAWLHTADEGCARARDSRYICENVYMVVNVMRRKQLPTKWLASSLSIFRMKEMLLKCLLLV